MIREDTVRMGRAPTCACAILDQKLAGRRVSVRRAQLILLLLKALLALFNDNHGIQ